MRARKALDDAGLPSDVPLERASSVTNEVWITPEHVVRVNRHPNRRLEREAFLGPRLPDDVGYPGVVAYGGEIGADCLIVERRHGDVLSRAWPTMHRDERRRAVAQLATLLKRLHDTPAPAGLPPTATPQLLSSDVLPAVAPLLEGLDRAAELDHVDAAFVTDLRAAVRDLGVAVEPFASTTLIHGDLHFENVLWDGYVVTALLDFEYARPAPPDLELDVFLRFCAHPQLHVAEDYEHLTRPEDYAEIPWWLADEYPELFAHPRVYDRARIYCLAYDVRDLLEVPPDRPVRELHEHHAYHRLGRLLRGESHVDRYAGHASSFTLTAAELLAATGTTSGAPAGLAPLAPGAAEERLARGSSTSLPLARRRAATSADEQPGEADAAPPTAPPGREPATRWSTARWSCAAGTASCGGAAWPAVGPARSCRCPAPTGPSCCWTGPRRPCPRASCPGTRSPTWCASSRTGPSRGGPSSPTGSAATSPRSSRTVPLWVRPTLAAASWHPTRATSPPPPSPAEPAGGGPRQRSWSPPASTSSPPSGSGSSGPPSPACSGSPSAPSPASGAWVPVPASARPVPASAPTSAGSNRCPSA